MQVRQQHGAFGRHTHVGSLAHKPQHFFDAPGQVAFGRIDSAAVAGNWAWRYDHVAVLGEVGDFLRQRHATHALLGSALLGRRNRVRSTLKHLVEGIQVDKRGVLPVVL